MFNIFQQPWTLVVIAFAAYVAIWLWRTVAGEKVSKKYFLIPIVLIVLAFAIDGFFKTDREKVNSLIKVTMGAIENEDIDTIDKVVSPSYEDIVHRSKAEILTYGRVMLEMMPVRKIKKQSSNLEFSDSSAQTLMSVVIHFGDEAETSEVMPLLVVKARVHFVKTADKKWLINSTELLKINNQPIGWRKVKKYQ